MNEIVISVENVSKIFDKTHKKSFFAEIVDWVLLRKKNAPKDHVIAVNNLSLEIPKGELLGILGNNGSGKSTLLKIISGIMTPTKGRVVTEGEIVSFFDIGSAIVPELTGTENIFIICKFQGLSTKKIKEIYPVIAAFSELGDFLDTPVKYYSSGMTMRLAFSAMIHIEKDIFLFDEVFSVGDILFREKCQERLFKLKNDGHTMILVSHNLNELGVLCDRICLMDEGKIIAMGLLEDVFKVYNNVNYKADNKSGKRKTLFQRSKSGFEEPILSSVKWPHNTGPGDNRCRLLSAEFTKNSDSDNASAQDLTLKIQSRCSQFKGGIGIIISDMLNHKLFGDTTFAFAEKNESTEMTGDYDLLWKIPKSRLNPGIYKITLHIMDENKSLLYRLVNALLFEIEFTDENLYKLYTPLKMDMELTINKH